MSRSSTRRRQLARWRPQREAQRGPGGEIPAVAFDEIVAIAAADRESQRQRLVVEGEEDHLPRELVVEPGEAIELGLVSKVLKNRKDLDAAIKRKSKKSFNQSEMPK